MQLHMAYINPMQLFYLRFEKVSFLLLRVVP